MFSNQNRCEYHAAPIKQFRFSSLGLCDIEFSYQNVGVDRRVLRLCRNPGLNQGPLDLQSNALPTELFRPTRYKGAAHDLNEPIFCDFCELYIRFDFPISNAVENTNMYYPLKNTSQIQLYLIYSVSAFSIISKFSCVGRESNPDRLLGRQPC